MSDKPYWEEPPGAALRSWVLSQMLRGAGYGALFVFGIGLLLYAIWGFGLLLPEASKQAPPPMGFLIEAPAEVRPA
jgi:hypothetical protein